MWYNQSITINQTGFFCPKGESIVPKSPNQKLKILYIMQMLKDTDENNKLSTARIIELLAAQDIECERKSLYSDIEALKNFGLDIGYDASRGGGYYLMSRDFELPELRLLVDAVQCSRFVTQKKTLELIKKLENLCGKTEAQKLNGQVFVFDRIKHMNESIYYNVDAIHEAIMSNKTITFKYFDYTVDKKKKYRHGDKVYEVVPLSLAWEDENYYLIAVEDSTTKHFRVDKMDDITVTDTSCGEREQFDPAGYIKGVFSMYGGDRADVRLVVNNSLASVIIDRFGKDITMIPRDEQSFSVSVNVAVSPQFYSWIFGLSDKVYIESPASVREGMREYLEKVLKLYAD